MPQPLVIPLSITEKYREHKVLNVKWLNCFIVDMSRNDQKSVGFSLIRVFRVPKKTLHPLCFFVYLSQPITLSK